MDHELEAIERNNSKSKGKQKMKEKTPNSDSEDEGSYSTDEGLNSKKMSNKKGRLKCAYCIKSYHTEK